MDSKDGKRPGHRLRRLGLATAILAFLAVPAQGLTMSSLGGDLQVGLEPWATFGKPATQEDVVGAEALAIRVLGSQDVVAPGGASNSWGLCYRAATDPPATSCGCVLQGAGPCESNYDHLYESTVSQGLEGGRAWIHQRQQVGLVVIEHTWRPAEHPVLEDLVEATVKVTNMAPVAAEDVRYRRAAAFTGVTGPASITLGPAGPLPGPAAWSSDFGLAIGNPELPFMMSAVPGSGTNCTLGPGTVSAGPAIESRSAPDCASGATFQVHLGRLESGASRSFRMLYGLAPSVAQAKEMLADASVYMLAQTPAVATWSLHGLRGPTAAIDVQAMSGLCSGGLATLAHNARPGDWPIADLLWDFGDGSVAGFPFAANVRHTFQEPGTHTLTLRVTDTNGWTAESRVPVLVQECPGGATDTAPSPVVTLPDKDGDGLADGDDPCVADASQEPPCAPPAPRPAKADADRPMVAVVTFNDRDGDGVADTADNCPVVVNRAQRNMDADLQGDACDDDLDGDGVVQAARDARVLLDNCPTTPNPEQDDRNHDATGDACQTLAIMPLGADPAKAGAQLPVNSDTSAVGVALALLAGLGILAAAGAAVRKWYGLPLLLLFSRLKESDVLEHPVRREIMQRVEAEPGMHCQAIVRKLDRHRGLVEHHLQVLVRNGHIKEIKTAGYLCYYPANLHDRKAMEAGSMIRSGLAREVLQAIVRNPGSTIPNIAKLVGAEYGAVSYHVKRFETAGLVELHGTNGHTQAMPQALALRALGLTGAPEDLMVRA